MQPEKEHFSSIFILLKESEFVINVLVFLYKKHPMTLHSVAICTFCLYSESDIFCTTSTTVVLTWLDRRVAFNVLQ